MNVAYENDLGQFDAQQKFSSSNVVPAVSAQTEKGSLVCIIRVKVNKNTLKSIELKVKFHLFLQVIST